MAEIRFSDPEGVPAPMGPYSQAALIQGAGRRLVISGQIGQRADGTVPEAPAAQMAQALANLQAVLAAHAMRPGQVVRVLVLLTDRALLPEWRQARNAAFGAHRPCSTLMIVAGLADPRLVVEVEAEAID
ncbi:RidA family protein [Pseudoroseomonas cervicalis]|uniref:RidA family protein n=1 Tax=Teichococcus cervicalis TaxID=204525 RepID=UPI002788EF35|nr:RidA family protein [Pseudoroseomonas cervicalis]MDQ1081585.1 2-iminobutanoate/2-iminopropanoate deaminase [Pseudoroseomonas cervicalis]